MFKARLKRQFFRTANLIGRINPTGRPIQGPLVLVYHGVEKELVDTRVQTLHVPLRSFERQMAYLRTNGQVISIDDLHGCLIHHQPMDRSLVLITFDDGYKNNLSLAAPVLRSMGFPFSVFISTRHIEERRRFPIYRLRAAIHYGQKKSLTVGCLNMTFKLETAAQRKRALEFMYGMMKTGPRPLVESMVHEITHSVSEEGWRDIDQVFSSEEPMDWNDIRELSRNGVIIGSHCHDHFILNGSQQAKEVERQLSTSKELIAQKAGRCDYIAYPNGGKNDITPEALRLVKGLRYVLGFTSVKGVVRDNSSPFLLPRVFAPDDLDRFVFRVGHALLYDRGYSRWVNNLGEAGRPD